MSPVIPPFSDSNARDRLEKELQEESQRIKEACLQLTQIDSDIEPNRYQALVCAMVDALDRQGALDKGGSSPSAPAQHADLFEGMGIEPGALNALISHLRQLSAGDEMLSNRFHVLNDYVNRNRVRNDENVPADSNQPSINWEALAERMEALRQRLYRETEEDRVQSRRR